MGLIKALAVISSLLEKLLEIIQNYVEKKESERDNAKAQENRDAIDRDPVDWLNQHFGMPEESSKSASSASTEAKD